MKDQLKNIKTLIIKGKEHQALPQLVTLLKAETEGKSFLNQAFLLNSRSKGIEKKFNEGIITFEKWETTRNRIVQSTLTLLKQFEEQVDKTAEKAQTKEGENKPSQKIVSNSTFIHRLANPIIARNMAFYFLLLWLLVGALDTLFFSVSTVEAVATYSFLGISFSKYYVEPNKEFITWLTDFLGHWFAFGTLILAITLEIFTYSLSRTSQYVLNKANDLYTKYFPIAGLVILGMLGAAMYANVNTVSNTSVIQYWSNQIADPFLPAFLAFNYFLLVIIPLLFSMFYYCLLLHITIKEFKSFSSYSPFHGDGHFGLLSIGKSIFWGTIIVVLFMLGAFNIQLYSKQGEVTFGVFLAAFIFILLFWFGAINPLKKLSRKLGLVKEELYKDIKEEIRDTNIQIGRQGDEEELNGLKSILETSKSEEQHILNVKTFLIAPRDVLIGGVIFIGLLISIVYNLSASTI